MLLRAAGQRLLLMSGLHASQSLQDAASRIEQHSTATIARILCGAAKASHYTPAVEYLAGSRRLADGLQTLSWGSLRAFLFALAKLDCRPANVWEPLEAAVSSKGAVACRVFYSIRQNSPFQRLTLAFCTMDVLMRRLIGHSKYILGPGMRANT